MPNQYPVRLTKVSTLLLTWVSTSLSVAAPYYGDVTGTSRVSVLANPFAPFGISENDTAIAATTSQPAPRDPYLSRTAATPMHCRILKNSSPGCENLMASSTFIVMTIEATPLTM
jgi:hypothetical protein